MSIFEELKRRKVIRVGLAYLVAAWLVVQVAELVADSFGAPPWFMQMLLVLVALGLPLALFLAWAFELTPQGLVRDEEVTPAASASSSRLLSGVTLVLLVLALGYFIWESRFSDREPEQGVAAESAAKAAPEPATEDEGMGDSIAVLPFENFSGNPEEAYFADGLADTLLHKLAQIDQLKVIARNSSFQFKGQNRDVREIGEILGVDVVLEGSVQRAGDQVRIIAQLVRTSDGAHLWSQSFDDSMANIFSLQDQVATDIARQLKVDLSADQRRRMLRDGTESPEAYDLLIRAQNTEIDTDDMADVDEATWPRLVMIRQAIELDPGYVQAWSNLAFEYSTLAFATRNSEKYQKYVGEAEQAARKALELGPDLADGPAAMGWVAHRKGERIEAEQYFRRALEIDPNDSSVLSGLALQIIGTNPEEALELLDRVLEYHPTAVIAHRQKHFALAFLGRYDEAIAELRLALEKDPDAGMMYNDLADLLVQRKGRPDEAAVVVSHLLRQQPNSYEGIAAMQEIWTWAGGFEEAAAWGDMLIERHPASDRARLRNAIRLVAAGQFPAVLEILETLPADDDDRGWAASLRATACLSMSQRECARQQIQVMSDALVEARAKGRVWVGSGITLLMLEILEADDGSEPATMSLSQAADLVEQQSYFEVKYFLRAGIAARQGRTEQAMELLEHSLQSSDPGIFGLDMMNLTVENSLLLNPLRGLPEFEDWLLRHQRQRSALIRRMRQLEGSADIISAASVARLATDF